MKIILDAMGGDFAPDVVVEGAALVRKEMNHELILVGDETKIRLAAGRVGVDLSDPGIRIVHCTQVVSMEDAPLSVREKADSSLRVGFKLLKEGEGDAFVSAGNTGALHAGSTLYVHRIKGVLRSAIATILPLEKPVLLIDSGANAVVDAAHLYQFAIMGSIYMERIFGISRPTVGLLNIGTESKKGTPMHIETYEILRQSKIINFIGNVEGKEVPFGKCDILVTDGFTGNVLLKTIEGMGSFFSKKLKTMFKANPVSMVSAVLVKKQIDELKNSFDASEYGGAPFLGISRPVIKAHGSSDAKAIKNAVKQAVFYNNTGIIRDIAKNCELPEGVAVSRPKPKAKPSETPATTEAKSSESSESGEKNEENK
ncbi:MAG: phosphate acyltransferase PlsX [Ruminococcaceae bacterium]|nr:phosphate acyltransferase PlsX [Oscillospiraceae bacterium]